MGKHDEAWMVLKHIHDTNMRARGEPERVFTVSTRLPVPFPHCCSAVGGWQISVSPCRWTGLKSPSSWTSWWRCRMSQPTLCSRSSSRSKLSSEEYVWVVFFVLFFPHVPVLSPSGFMLRENSLLSWTDLVDIHEMLQLPSERQHFKAGCRLVYSLLWVRSSLLAHFFFLLQHHFYPSWYYYPKLL